MHMGMAFATYNQYGNSIDMMKVPSVEEAELNFHAGVILWILDIELQKVISFYVQRH